MGSRDLTAVLFLPQSDLLDVNQIIKDLASMVSEQGEAIGGYPQHLPSHLPCLPQAGLGGPVSGFCPESFGQLPRGGVGTVWQG